MVALLDPLVKERIDIIHHGDFHDDRAGDQHSIKAGNDQSTGSKTCCIELVHTVCLYNGTPLTAGKDDDLASDAFSLKIMSRFAENASGEICLVKQHWVAGKQGLACGITR